MTGQPLELSLELNPSSRFDLIDVRRRVLDEVGDLFRRYRRSLYCSYHTTAGFLDEVLYRRLAGNQQGVHHFFSLFGRIFPPDADYRHDDMSARSELSAAQRVLEPRNADSHLTYIGSGLRSCVTYENEQDRPVFFVDLDGEFEGRCRVRRTTVLAFDAERRVGSLHVEIPVSAHPVDSVNLRTEPSGFHERLAEFLADQDVDRGRLDISLRADEAGAGLTVNEFETLLMRHDLVDVLRNPFHFMAEQGRHVLANPGSVPAKAWNYAKYDFIQLVNEVIDALGLSESFVERIVARTAAIPASRMLRTKRSISLLVARDESTGVSRVVQGRYQSPILFQWQGPKRQARKLDVTLSSFE
jgi:thiamine phosphate synthase YjbQ (UPF0047 family)